MVLFDEIEKAHKSVYDLLLNLLDCGELTDAKGNQVSFKNAIIIFTTNAGYGHNFNNSGVGFLKEKGRTSDINKSLEKVFSPEFLGRIDDVIIYNSLPETIINELIERHRKFFEKTSGIKVKFSKKNIEEIKEMSNIEKAGARGLIKAVQTKFAEIATEKENSEDE